MRSVSGDGVASISSIHQPRSASVSRAGRCERGRREDGQRARRREDALDGVLARERRVARDLGRRCAEAGPRQEMTGTFRAERIRGRRACAVHGAHQSQRGDDEEHEWAQQAHGQAFGGNGAITIQTTPMLTPAAGRRCKRL
jgi:hypothetical protein